MSTTLQRLPRMAAATALLIGLGAAAIWAPAARAATIAVTTTADELNADGDCSLREALEAANADQPVDACAAGSGADTILVPAGAYTLEVAGSGPAAGTLDLASDLTLAGAGIDATVIDGNGVDGVLSIYAESAVTIAGLTVRGGDSGVSAGSGIWINNSAATLSRVRVTENAPNHSIYLVGAASLVLEDSLVERNSGGGIYLQPASSATILSSTIAGNTGAANGGGIFSGGALTVVNSTISGNSTAGHGGGIFAAGAAFLFNATIADNTADSEGDEFGDGGGLYSLELPPRARNTLIGGNSDASPITQRPDCAGRLVSEGHNLIESTAGCSIQSGAGDLTGLSPALGPLRDNGGETLTHALQADSPAVDAGAPRGCADHEGRALAADQRGFVRPVDGGSGGARCDIGAYEYGSPGASTPTPTRAPTGTPANELTATAQASPGPADPAPPSATPTTAPGEGPAALPQVYLPLVVR